MTVEVLLYAAAAIAGIAVAWFLAVFTLWMTIYAVVSGLGWIARAAVASAVWLTSRRTKPTNDNVVPMRRRA